MAAAFPFTVRTTGRLVFLKLFHEVTRAGAEGGHRLDVLGKVKHDSAPVNSTLLGAIHRYTPSPQSDQWVAVQHPEPRSSFRTTSLTGWCGWLRTPTCRLRRPRYR